MNAIAQLKAIFADKPGQTYDDFIEESSDWIRNNQQAVVLLVEAAQKLIAHAPEDEPERHETYNVDDHADWMSK